MQQLVAIKTKNVTTEKSKVNIDESWSSPFDFKVGIGLFTDDTTFFYCILVQLVCVLFLSRL